jgi:hypothetical protein
MTDPLDDLLHNMPAEGASEAEIEAFMEKVMTTPGGADLISDFAQKITDGGALDTMLKEEEDELETLTLKSPARFIFRVELLGTTPPIWRRLSLPADCSYLHLHRAIQDAFGWQDTHDHRIEVWEDGNLELIFSPDEDDDRTHYCEVQNRLMDLFLENVSEFQYLYDSASNWRHRIVIEDFVQAGEKETSAEFSPHLHNGAGHGPPEDCGGLSGFQKFLKGDHPSCKDYEPEVLEEFRSGNPDFSKITFRDPASVRRK